MTTATPPWRKLAAWGVASHSRDGDKLEILVILVEAYEAVHWPIAGASPTRPPCFHRSLGKRPARQNRLAGR